jgi:hypothetical protein
VQIDICQQRGDDRPLRRSNLLPYPFAVFDIAGLEPFAYEAKYPLIFYSDFQEVQQPLVVQVIKESFDISIRYNVSN